jgi:hypothetical protein
VPTRSFREAVGARSVTRDAWRDIRALLVEWRSIEYAQRVAAEYVERAKKGAVCVPVVRGARSADVSSRLRALARLG